MKKTIPVLIAVLLALVACGSKQDNGNAKKDDTGDMVKFAQCMRDNGVDMPDPEDNGKGGVVMRAAPAEDAGSDGQASKFEAAHNACKQHLPNGGEFKPPSPEEQDKMRQQAKCMRDKGHNWPDPQFDGNAKGQAIELPDMEDEKVKQDMKDCGLNIQMATAPEEGK
ncbi:hypothetical protein C8D87_106537 [Lentzea atacamensis]|uniref:Secreted protein n=1 Tax=Lentzea atacamensis TaxID=531938 RepID=A0ABX9E4Z4_9PSEU|nr:hypothetical protein [Lentzea atacamensis]RAS64131.1 hypothetical protein C8D87_106537 [Lentzea atacamensis]